MPTFVTAHTFCALRDTWVSYGWCLLIQGFFALFKTIQRKQDLANLVPRSQSSVREYPKRKLGVAMHFSEIIKVQFEKQKTPYIALYFTAFFY